MRRTRDEPPRSRAHAPDDDPSAEAETLRAHGAEACVAPQLLERYMLMEVTNARTEEAAHLPPAGRHDRSGERQPDSHVQLPQRPPHSPRYVELEHRDDAARLHHARELPQGRERIVHVAQEIRERER